MPKVKFWSRAERPRGTEQQHLERLPVLANKLLLKSYRELIMKHIRVDEDAEDPRQRYVVESSLEHLEARLLLDLQQYLFPASNSISCSG